MRALLAACLLLASCAAAAAQTTLNLSATGDDNVDPDLITASLNAQAGAADAVQAQTAVNQTMAQALALAKTYLGVTATTGDYNVYQNTPDGAQKPVYQASQSLQLSMLAPDGLPPDNFARLVGQLQQKGMLLNSLNGDLSDPAHQAAQQGAIDDAIRQIQAQARAIAATLGEQVGRIQTLNVNINTPGPMPRAPMMLMAAKATTPVAAPGKVDVQANVSATIALDPKPPGPGG